MFFWACTVGAIILISWWPAMTTPPSVVLKHGHAEQVHIVSLLMQGNFLHVADASWALQGEHLLIIKLKSVHNLSEAAPIAKHKLNNSPNTDHMSKVI